VAFLERFVAASAGPPFRVHFLKFQWGRHDHRNGSGSVGETAQQRSSSLPGDLAKIRLSEVLFLKI
jgi:hypothetical protein